MTAEEKILFIEKQMHACEDERTNTINCPYCGKQNKDPEEPLCCAEFSVVVLAILDRWAADAERQRFEQIYENVN